MKIQRSHFRLITLFLLYAFLATMLLCAVHTGLISSPLPGDGEGNPSAAEESLNETESGSDSEDSEPEDTALPPEEYVTTGL